MTLLFVLLESGGSTVEEAGAGNAPYYIAGFTLLVFVALIVALLAFGKGREHS